MKPEDIKAKEDIVHDTRLSMEARRQAHKDIMDAVLNPVPSRDFNPETFDPIMDDVSDAEVMRRPRKEPPRTLPTLGLKPKELYEGQLIGMYESKQDLYLLIAWLSKRVSDLEDRMEG